MNIISQIRLFLSEEEKQHVPSPPGGLEKSQRDFRAEHERLLDLHEDISEGKLEGDQSHRMKDLLKSVSALYLASYEDWPDQVFDRFSDLFKMLGVSDLSRLTTKMQQDTGLQRLRVFPFQNNRLMTSLTPREEADVDGVVLMLPTNSGESEYEKLFFPFDLMELQDTITKLKEFDISLSGRKRLTEWEVKERASKKYGVPESEIEVEIPQTSEWVSFSWGTTPEPTIVNRLPESYPIRLSDFDHDVVESALGFYSRKDPKGAAAVMRTVGQNPYRNFSLNKEQMMHLLRALSYLSEHGESSDVGEEAGSLRSSILQTLKIEEV